MALIIKDTIHDAYGIRSEFVKMNRDYYPMPVYEWIYDFIEDCYPEDEPYLLDPIGWCCDIQQLEFEDADEEFEDIQEYAASLDATVIYIDEDAGIVYAI